MASAVVAAAAHSATYGTFAPPAGEESASPELVPRAWPSADAIEAAIEAHGRRMDFYRRASGMDAPEQHPAALTQTEELTLWQRFCSLLRCRGD